MMMEFPECAKFVRRLGIHDRAERRGREDSHGALFTVEAKRCQLDWICSIEAPELSDLSRAALLVHLLPELEVLSVRCMDLRRYSRRIGGLMDKQVSSAKLRFWEIGSMEVHCGIPSNTLIPVLLYPSMKVIKAYKVHTQTSRPISVRDDKLWNPAQSNHGKSYVDAIMLYESVMSALEIAEMFRLCNALKIFVFRDGVIHYDRPDTEVRELLQCTLELVAPTLELLDLVWEGYDDRMDAPTFCSLHNLTSVRTLRIDLSVLASHEDLTRSTTPSCLANLLPPFLETLVIYPPTNQAHLWREGEYFECIAGLLKHKSSAQLPNLRTVTCIRHSPCSPFPSWLIELAQERGVRIDPKRREGYNT
ncbi:hypothetical protein CPB86DRAFT_812690 [Serendipita vermifera]|nr:hypothetical protein CPB86DRAFT_812690 [Serendipita vermifera]